MDASLERARRVVRNRYLIATGFTSLLLFVLPEPITFLEWRLSVSVGQLITFRLVAVAVGVVFWLTSLLAARRALKGRDAVPANFLSDSEVTVRRVAWTSSVMGWGAIGLAAAIGMLRDVFGIVGFTVAVLTGLVAVHNEALWIRRLEVGADGPTSAST